MGCFGGLGGVDREGFAIIQSAGVELGKVGVELGWRTWFPNQSKFLGTVGCLRQSMVGYTALGLGKEKWMGKQSFGVGNK